jgi:DNA processing protein
MDYPVRILEKSEFPKKLGEIPDAPTRLFVRGSLPDPTIYTYLCVVGSRHFSSYGKDVCEKLIAGLRGFPITIVSGLAHGIDAIAHKAALDANLPTIAIPGSGLDDDTIYPRNNARLALRILDAGGALLSEYTDYEAAAPWMFPQRNRLMAGISHATLIIEASIKSGTLITARLSTDYNRDVLAVPGSIYSNTSAGPHLLIKLGATPITSAADLLDTLGFVTEKAPKDFSSCTPDELAILDLLTEPMSKEKLCEKLDKPIHQINILVSILELKGLIVERCGELHLS